MCVLGYTYDYICLIAMKDLDPKLESVYNVRLYSHPVVCPCPPCVIHLPPLAVALVYLPVHLSTAGASLSMRELDVVLPVNLPAVQPSWGW